MGTGTSKVNPSGDKKVILQTSDGRQDKEKKLLPVTTSPVTTSEAVPSTSAVNQSEMGTSTSAVNQFGDKKVILQTSDGRQVMLTLVKEITYTELQKLIYQTVEVPANRQKIRGGLPPKLLNVPVEGEEEGIIQLQHGDKIALEVLPDTSLPIQESQGHLVKEEQQKKMCSKEIDSSEVHTRTVLQIPKNNFR